MNDLGMSIKHAKRRGEWAGLRFMACASERGLCVSKPWGETSHYDFVVEDETGHLIRVQVKSTRCRKNGGYACAVRGSQGVYVAGAFDFLAAYLIPEDLWYIIPAEKIQGYGSIMLYPTHLDSKYTENLNAWNLLGSSIRSGVSDPDVIPNVPRGTEGPNARVHHRCSLAARPRGNLNGIPSPADAGDHR